MDGTKAATEGKSSTENTPGYQQLKNKVELLQQELNRLKLKEVEKQQRDFEQKTKNTLR